MLTLPLRLWLVGFTLRLLAATAPALHLSSICPYFQHSPVPFFSSPPRSRERLDQILYFVSTIPITHESTGNLRSPPISYHSYQLVHDALTNIFFHHSDLHSLLAFDKLSITLNQDPNVNIHGAQFDPDALKVEESDGQSTLLLPLRAVGRPSELTHHLLRGLTEIKVRLQDMCTHALPPHLS